MAPLSYIKFVQDQLTALPSPDDLRKDLTGKTVVVIGGNSGLGLEASRHFASMNPKRLILGCRTAETAEQAVEDIKGTTGIHNIEWWPIDYTSFASVSAFATRFEKEGDGQLDILVENAGIATNVYEATPDGFESSIQTNLMSTALVSLLLLPYLSKTPNSRLTIVASDAHFLIPRVVEADYPKILVKLNEKNYCTAKVMTERYNLTKLLLILYGRALVERLPAGTSVTVDWVTPGMAESQVSRNLSGILYLGFELLRFFFARTTEYGSRTLVHGALAGTQETMQGKYLNLCRVEEESDFVISEEGKEVQERIWNEVVESLSEKDSRVKGIVKEFLRD